MDSRVLRIHETGIHFLTPSSSHLSFPPPLQGSLWMYLVESSTMKSTGLFLFGVICMRASYSFSGTQKYRRIAPRIMRERVIGVRICEC